MYKIRLASFGSSVKVTLLFWVSFIPLRSAVVSSAKLFIVAPFGISEFSIVKVVRVLLSLVPLPSIVTVCQESEKFFIPDKVKFVMDEEGLSVILAF
ncbi:MAG: hypothetical protein J6N73_00740 [Prevotella sp.]|nr:hypothetical protein [Prevotella sp.]